jgi:DNA-directed RNA polymerase specialized sigma24 family protein
VKAKDFFRRARSAEQDIKRLERVIDHYSSVGAAISSKWGGVGGGKGNNSSRVETAAVGLFDAEKSILDELKRYRAIVAEAENVISRISQERFRELLTLHYLAGMSFAEVQKAMNYNQLRSVYRVNGFALAAAQVIIDQQEGKHEVHTSRS